jgi:glutaconate CoA-transferase subunit B
MNYSPAELMTINGARLLRDGDVVFVGVGLPNLACNLAHRTHAPHLTMVYEAGVIGARPARLPLSIGDPTLVSGAAAVCSMYEIFAFYLQRGLIDVGFLGGAQIDRFANVNATVIGPYAQPKVRLPGSGGSAEIAAWAKRTYFLTPHQKRRFPEKCDFVTGAGFPAQRDPGVTGRAAREQGGARGGGPHGVVTDIGLLEPDASGELVLTALHPGRTVEDARANTGWELKVAEHVRVTDPPTADELRLLRQELDPRGIYLKGGV